MRLGGPVFSEAVEPEAWVRDLGRQGYRAGVFPLSGPQTLDVARAYAAAAARADIILAEVGVWNNPLDTDQEKRRAAIDLCRERLALADEIGARCCVNIAGSRGGQWDGPDPANLTAATFDLIVETTRSIIDAVKPTRTYYTLEPMPWVYPDSPDSYLRLLQAVDRERFAVHLDPVNMITSPERFFNNAAFLRECFAKLGPHIKSCHAKDITLSGRLTVHLDEAPAGRGALDYRVYLAGLERIDPEMPLIIEHLETEEEAAAAADFIRRTVVEIGIGMR